MFTVIVTLDIEPGHVKEFETLVTAIAATSVEDEPGCLAFEVSQSLHRLNRFHLYEVYTDQEAFSQHKGTDHFAEFIARSAPLTIPDSKHEIYATRIAAEKKRHDHAL